MIIPKEINVRIKEEDQFFDDIEFQITIQDIEDVLRPLEGESLEMRKARFRDFLNRQIVERIVAESNDHKKAFGKTPFWFKILTFSAIFTEAYFLMSNIEALSSDEMRGTIHDLIVLWVLRGKSGFDGAGGFLYDVFNFLSAISKAVSDLGNPKNKKSKMSALLAFFVFVAAPFLLFGYSELRKICEKSSTEHYMHITSILAVMNGFAMVALCVLTGVILRYFTFLILKLVLKKKEFDASMDLANTYVTKREWFIRIVFGLAVGSIGAFLLPYLKSIIMEKLSMTLGKSHFVTEYVGYTMSGMIILFGLHVAALRIIIPAVIKLFIKFLTNDKGRPKKIRMAITVFFMYFGAIALFGAYAVLEKYKYFGENLIFQNFMQQLTLFVAIGLNILGGIFIFKMMSLFVDARSISNKLLSGSRRGISEAERRIATNKIIGTAIMLFSIAGIVAVIALFICGRVLKMGYVSKIIENQWIIAAFTTIFVMLFFASIAIFSRSHFIGVHLKYKNMKDIIDTIQDDLFIRFEGIYNEVTDRDNTNEATYVNVEDVHLANGLVDSTSENHAQIPVKEKNSFEYKLNGIEFIVTAVMPSTPLQETTLQLGA